MVVLRKRELRHEEIPHTTLDKTNRYHLLILNERCQNWIYQLFDMNFIVKVRMLWRVKKKKLPGIYTQTYVVNKGYLQTRENVGQDCYILV